jgi:hypothetical protein
MGKSTKRMSAPWGNTAGQRGGMASGKAPAPGKPGGQSRGHIHDAGYSYAAFAKSEPRTFGQGKGKGKGAGRSS